MWKLTAVMFSLKRKSLEWLMFYIWTKVLLGAELRLWFHFSGLSESLHDNFNLLQQLDYGRSCLRNWHFDLIIALVITCGIIIWFHANQE